MLSTEKLDRAGRSTLSGRARKLLTVALALCAVVIIAIREPSAQLAVAQPPSLLAAITLTVADNATYPLAELSSEVQSATALRPSEIFRQPEPFQAWLKSAPLLRGLSTLKPDDFESLVLVRSGGNVTTANFLADFMNFNQVMISLKQGTDWAKLLETGGTKSAAASSHGKSFLRFVDLDSMGAYPVTPNQLLIAPVSHIEAVLAGKVSDAPAEWKKVLQTAAASPLVTVIPGATFAKFRPNQPTASGGVPRDPAEGVVLALTPRLEMAVMTAHVDDAKGLQFELTYPTEADAQAALAASAPQVERLQQIISAISAQVEQFEKAPSQIQPGTPQAELQQRKQFVTGLSQMLAGYAAKPEGNRLHISTETDVTKLASLADAFSSAQAAAARQRSMNNLKQIMLAMHMYQDTYRHFPLAASQSKEGKPLLSWRVALLPFLEQDALYKQFHLDEPWDSEHNKPLLDKMPEVYRSAALGTDADPNVTSVLAIVGPHAGLDQSKPRTIRQYTDGTSNTAMIVETKNDIPWTKPSDLEFDPTKDFPKISGYHPGGDGLGFIAGFADGHVRFIGPNVDKELLKKVFTIDGKEAVQLP